MDTIECMICLNDISCNDYITLTCCKNDVHIYCLNDWIHQNITKKNISKCFICSQENIILQDIVSYNSPILKLNTNSSNIINDSTNNINEIVIHNDNNFTTIAYNLDKRLYFFFIYVKLCFLVSMSSLLMFILYYLI